MTDNEQQDIDLKNDHTPEAIHVRLQTKGDRDYLRDMVLGAIDGTVTTFAIVAGVVGSGMPANVALILGIANLFADGFSMAAGNFAGTQTENELLHKARKEEQHHIEKVPEGEREEIRQIFANKGFEGNVLEEITSVITNNKKLWIDTMVNEELGLQLKPANPRRAAIATFAAFCLAGFVPILPYILPRQFVPWDLFVVSSIVTSLTFLGIGFLKGVMTTQSVWRSSIQTWLIGTIAAVIAYGIGRALRTFGISD